MTRERRRRTASEVMQEEYDLSQVPGPMLSHGIRRYIFFVLMLFAVLLFVCVCDVDGFWPIPDFTV